MHRGSMSELSISCIFIYTFEKIFHIINVKVIGAVLYYGLYASKQFSHNAYYYSQRKHGFGIGDYFNFYR